MSKFGSRQGKWGRGVLGFLSKLDFEFRASDLFRVSCSGSRNRPSFQTQELECVIPLVAQKTRDEPEHAKRLNRAGRFGHSHVGGFPPELVKDAAHGLL